MLIIPPRKHRILHALSTLTLVLALALPKSASAVTKYQVSNLNDVSLPSNWNGVGNLTASDDICVYIENGSDDSYGLKAYTNRGAFEMSKGSGSALPLQVHYKGSAGGAGSYTLMPYDNFRTFGGGNRTSATCSSEVGLNGNLKVVVTESALGAAAWGTYSVTLYIVIGPAT